LCSLQSSTLSTTILQGGTLTVANGFIATQGEVSAFGTIAGTLQVGGTLDMGTAVGSLTVTGDYNQTPSGLLKIKIGGKRTSYDTLVVGGTAAFGFAGQLEVDLSGGYAPQQGDSFSIISAGNIAGVITNPTGYTVSQAGGIVAITKN
jgi:hypothetical protein